MLKGVGYSRLIVLTLVGVEQESRCLAESYYQKIHLKGRVWFVFGFIFNNMRGRRLFESNIDAMLMVQAKSMNLILQFL